MDTSTGSSLPPPSTAAPMASRSSRTVVTPRTLYFQTLASGARPRGVLPVRAGVGGRRPPGRGHVLSHPATPRVRARPVRGRGRRNLARGLRPAHGDQRRSEALAAHARVRRVEGRPARSEDGRARTSAPALRSRRSVRSSKRCCATGSRRTFRARRSSCATPRCSRSSTRSGPPYAIASSRDCGSEHGPAASIRSRRWKATGCRWCCSISAGS